MDEILEQFENNEEVDEILEQPIKVYIKVDSNLNVIEINSEIFITDFTDWFYIDEGYGDKYAHAQGHYFENPLINDNGEYNYKYINNEIIKEE